MRATNKMQFKIFFPVKPANVNQGFGVANPIYNGIIPSGKHNGIDFQAYHGQPVYATHDGVCYVEVDANQGHGVVLRTLQQYDRGPNDPTQVFFKTIYWHLATGECHGGIHKIQVVDGQHVKAGDLLGFADNTGLSTGDHLHFGEKPCLQGEESGAWFNSEQNNGYLGAIDPALSFNGYFAEDAQKILATAAESIAASAKIASQIDISKPEEAKQTLSALMAFLKLISDWLGRLGL